MEKISVAIRVRPPSKAQTSSPFLRGYKWGVGPHNVALYNALGTPVTGQNYSFDSVFGTDAKNEDIYEKLTKHVIMSSLDGFNGTVFAYGQTSSGKTYTMKGSPSDLGIIRLAVHDVFNQIRQLVNKREFLIRVSYMEIYNEDINDLFAPDNRRLRIHENIEKGIFVAGLREEIVDSPEQIFDLLEQGESHRHFGETNMNLYSSRSHTIFRMVIESRDKSQDGWETELSSDAVRVSCLNLVDLAGSERVAKTGAGGVRLKEGTHINKSLMTLGTVINKLSDGAGKQGGHIPYRDSKLTRILQPALGGNAKTVMICTVNPDEIHVDETRGTLQFASRAKRVSTCAQVNEIVTDAALLKRQTKEIEELRMKLQGLPQSAQFETEIRTLRNELLKFESEKEKLLAELQEEKRSQVEKERRIKEQEQKIENLSTFFTSSTVDEKVSPMVEKLAKKQVNRRETWCPRPVNSEIAAQDFRKSNDQLEDDETMDNILFSVRRDRTYTLPPAFEVGEETDPFWTGTGGIQSPQPPSDFENIADEDTWMSLNKGHTTSSTVFAPGFSERNASSEDSGHVQKLESQLQDLRVQYKELEGSCDLKIQKATEKLEEEVMRLKKQLDKAEDENLKLKDALGLQLEMHRELQCTLEDLEFEVDAARLQFSSLQGVVAESLHVQATVLLSVQDCTIVTSRQPFSSLKAKEKKRLLLENSVQQCRQICSEVDDIFLGKPARVGDTVPSVAAAIDHIDSSCRHDDAMCNLSDCPDDIPSIVADEVLRDQSSTTLSPAGSTPGNSQFCQSCLAPMIVTLKGCSENPANSNGKIASPLDLQNGITEELSPSQATDGMENAKDTASTSTCQRHGSSGWLDQDLSLSSSNAIKAHVLKALTSQFKGDSGDTRSNDYNGEEQALLMNIWNKMISCQHPGCSFGTMGANCDVCINFERSLARRNQIPTEMRNLCSNILKFLEPSLPRFGNLTQWLGRTEGGGLQEKGTLEESLATAKLLATWLLQEVQVVMRHDAGCLSTHLKERRNVGVLLEAFQVILLQLATCSVGLLQVFGEDECLQKELSVQLNSIKDAQTELQDRKGELLQSVKAAAAEITAREGAATVNAERPPGNYQAIISPFEVETANVPKSSTPSLFTERVVKVEEVEKLLGKVLQNSMGVLSTEHRVVSGNPMLHVLTLELENTPEKEQHVHLGDKLSLETIRHAEICTKSEKKLPKSGLMYRSHVLPEKSIAPQDLRSSTGSKVLALDRLEKMATCCSRPQQLSCGEDLVQSKRGGQLEMNLAAAELEIVELKIELEDLRAKLQTRVDMSQIESVQQMQLQLESYKNKCANFEQDMGILLAASPNSWELLERERRLVEVTEENQFLQDCLAKTKKYVLRSKAWRDEMRKWKGIQVTRRETISVSQSQVLFEGAQAVLPFDSSEKLLIREKIGSHPLAPIHSQSSLNDEAALARNRSDPKHFNPHEQQSWSEGDNGSRSHLARASVNTLKDLANNRSGRSPLRSMDVNLLEENHYDYRHCPKGKRQLQFPEDERC